MMCSKWNDFMNKLLNRDQERYTPLPSIHKAEAITALAALDEVGCVSVSETTADELGAFEESALSLDDILEDHEHGRGE